MFDNIFSSQTLEEAWEILITEFPLAIWETVYVTIIATLFAVIYHEHTGPKAKSHRQTGKTRV